MKSTVSLVFIFKSPWPWYQTQLSELPSAMFFSAVK